WTPTNDEMPDECRYASNASARAPRSDAAGERRGGGATRRGSDAAGERRGGGARAGRARRWATSTTAGDWSYARLAGWPGRGGIKPDRPERPGQPANRPETKPQPTDEAAADRRSRSRPTKPQPTDE